MPPLLPCTTTASVSLNTAYPLSTKASSLMNFTGNDDDVAMSDDDGFGDHAEYQYGDDEDYLVMEGMVCVPDNTQTGTKLLRFC
jgi:hypothetical protein